MRKELNVGDIYFHQNDLVETVRAKTQQFAVKLNAIQTELYKKFPYVVPNNILQSYLENPISISTETALWEYLSGKMCEDFERQPLGEYILEGALEKAYKTLSNFYKSISDITHGFVKSHETYGAGGNVYYFWDYVSRSESGKFIVDESKINELKERMTWRIETPEQLEFYNMLHDANEKLNECINFYNEHHAFLSYENPIKENSVFAHTFFSKMNVLERINLSHTINKINSHAI